MNAYWEPLDLQLPKLPGDLEWKICVNTFLPYEDGKDMGQDTEISFDSKLKVPPRTVVTLIGE